MKPLLFVGSSLAEMADFPPEPRRVAGYELWQVQNGLMPSDFKPMPTIGAGVYEIRVRRDGEWRVIYVASRREAVYVLHAFRKKTRATSGADIDIARRRFRQIGD